MLPVDMGKRFAKAQVERHRRGMGQFFSDMGTRYLTVAAGIAREAGALEPPPRPQPGPLPRRVGPQCQRQGAHRARAQSAGPGNGFAGQRRHIPPAQRRHRLSWAVLLARVFDFELSVCERCGGAVKVVAALTEPGAIRKYLPGVGLPARAPTMAPAGRRPQQEFDIDYAASAA